VDGTEFYIPIIFEYKTNGTFLKLEIHQDLFVKEFLDFDKKLKIESHVLYKK
jgi:hypothetical protein